MRGLPSQQSLTEQMNHGRGMVVKSDYSNETHASCDNQTANREK